MKKIIVICLTLAAVLTSCGERFKVSGTIEGAPQQYVYLEYVGLTEVVTLDSALLKQSGKFSFCSERPEYPDLYRLRVGKKTIILAVDSLDEIGVNANVDNILDATFTGSPKSEGIAQLRRSLRDNDLSEHKALARQMILNDPRSVVAYYALFQMKGQSPVFVLGQKEDRTYFQAVATSWNAWMPQNKRTKVLYQQVLDQLNEERRQLNTAMMQALIDEQENSFLDIELPDQNGNNRSLGSLRGKVIVLDFCSMEIENYQDYIFSMRDRYNRYHSKGLEVYQVYPDINKLVWENQVENLPWVSVRTDKGIADPVYTTYNVQTIPTMFLLDRKGNVVGRFVGFGGLDAAIEKIL